MSKEDKKWTQELIKAMKANVGEFVIHPEDAGDCDQQGNILYRRDTVYANPRNIGIIIDGGCGSSTEEFLLACRNSDKNVIFFGRENTSGTIDYSNAVPRDMPGGKYVLYMPMTRSMRLPENPIDGEGIAPDVIVPYPPVEHYYDRLDQWVYFVRDYLRLAE